MTPEAHRRILSAVLHELPDVGPWEVVIMVNLPIPESASQPASFTTNMLPLGRVAEWMRSSADCIERNLS